MRVNVTIQLDVDTDKFAAGAGMEVPAKLATIREMVKHDVISAYLLGLANDPYQRDEGITDWHWS